MATADGRSINNRASGGGRIHRLEVENFKSYKGTQTIGPFFDFTAIIGPNGAGKSNLMDAISFVLGVRSAHLRGAQLKDLIYALDDRDKEAKGRRASVRLVYHQPNQEELHFTRTITGAGGSEYRIDGRLVTWDDYNAKLRSLGILVKARNFLVFQGDVESIASKNPKELTALLEQISGSDELRREYDELEEQKARAEENSALVYQEKRTIVMERKQKKAQKEEAEKHLRLQQDLKLLKTEHSLWQLYTIEKDTEKMEAELAEDRESLQQVQEENQSADSELTAKKKEQSAFLKKMTLCEKSIAKKRLELDKKQPELLKLREQISRLKSKIKSCKKEIDKKKDDNKKHLEEMRRLQSALVDVTKAIEELNEQGQDKSEKLQLADDQLQEYHRITVGILIALYFHYSKEDAGMKTAKLRDEKEVIDKKLNADVEAKKNLEENMQQLRSREDEISSQERELQARLNKILNSIPKHENELTQLREEHNRITKERQSSGSRYQTLKQRVDEIDTQLRELKADKHEIVTVDGILLTKSGTMTGGISGGMEARSNKWDDSRIESLKKKKNLMETEMSELGSPRELQKKELAISEKITGLEKKLHYLNVEQNNLRAKLLKLTSERSNIEEEINRLEPGKEELETRIAEKEAEVSKLEKKINEIVDKLYRDFSISVGVKNIRQYEERQLKDAQALQERKLSLSNQMSKLKYQLEYEQKRDMQTPIVKLKETYESLEKELKGLQERESGAKADAEQISTEMDQLKAEAEDWKSKSDECENVIDQLKEQNANVASTLAKLDRQVKAKEGQLMQLMSRQREIHENCELEQLKLPTVNDPMDTGSSSQESVLDYSLLSKIYLKDMRPSERDKHEAEFKQRTDALLAEIERTAPNLKALDQYDALQRKEKEVTEKFEAARKEERDISDNFNSIKQRSFRPSPFFILDEVDAALDNLNVAKVAGFIRSKSCERVSDEQGVDGECGFQSIVISLKDSFYDKAEALVGVYRDSERSCSRTLTFDLTKYREA
nr:unnamed protein product [Digitaria exilis]